MAYILKVKDPNTNTWLGIPAIKGEKGDTALTVTVGNTTTLAPGSSASVINSGTNTDLILNFGIPKGDKGDKGDTGDASTIAVGTTTTGAAGSNASVTNSGTASNAVLNFTIPRGVGVVAGGTENQILMKNSSIDYDTKWGVIEVPSKISDLTDDTEAYPINKADTLTGLTATVEELNVLDGITANTLELNYCDGVTSNIQTQLNNKLSEQNELIQNISTLSTNAIVLDSTKGIYSKTISENTTFTFDASGLGTLVGKAVTFELYLTMGTVYTLTFPASVTWVAEPDFTQAGSYLVIFKSMDGGNNWVGNIEFKINS